VINLGPKTNKGVALFKLLHQREAAPLVEDHYVRWFLSETQLREIDQQPPMPVDPPDDPDQRFVWIAYWYTILRERFVDDAVVESMAHGCSQVLSLGAGFDTRFFRIIQPQSLATHTFEVDLSGTIDEKRQCILSEIGRIPEHLHMVAMDLVADNIRNLISQGFDPSLPTIYLLQGLSYYLPKPTAVGLLQFFAADAAPGSQLLYDSCYPTMIVENDEVPGIRAQINKLTEIGEPYRFGEPPKDAVSRLQKWGCDDVRTWGMQDLESQYLGRATLPEKMWFLVRATKPEE
jgi:methyltransferase (TIGR00027 family)